MSFNFTVLPASPSPRQPRGAYVSLLDRIMQDYSRLQAGQTLVVPVAQIPGGNYPSLRTEIGRRCRKLHLARPSTQISDDRQEFYVIKP